MRPLYRIGKAGILIAVLTVLGLVLAVGCEEELTPEEAEDQLCQDLAEFAVAVAQLQQVEPGTTVDELQTMKDDVAAAFETVKESAAEVAGVRIDDLEQAEANLEGAINGIPGDATIQEALGMIQDDVAAVVLAWDELEASLECGPAVSPAPSPTM